MEFELYKKMLKGDCSQEEAEQVLKWLQENPAAFDVAMLEEMNAMEHRDLPENIRQQMLSFFKAKGIETIEETPVIDISVERKKRRYLWPAAAAILLAIASGWIFNLLRTPASPSLAWAEIRNTSTNVKLVILPDSSKVWLNTQATLRYRKDFTRHPQREVQITGEGFFKVTHDPNHPFLVETDKLTTRVLGTEFNVEAYNDEKFIKVTLQQGSVQVNTKTDAGVQSMQQVLQPGQTALYARATAFLQVKSSSMANPDAWTKDGLVLNDVPLPDALKRISHKYNQPIVFDSLSAVKHRHITAYYRKMTIEQVLTQLGFTCQFNTEKKSDGYHLAW